jgi:GTP-binding protein
MAPFDESDPVEVFKGISRELEKFSPTLARRDRWLVLNKLDLIPEAERQQKCDDVVDRLKWDGPVFPVSAIQKDGTDKLCQAIMIHLEEQRSRLADDPEYAEQQKQLADKLDIEVRGRIAEYEELRRKIRQERKDKKNAEDDNFGVDVFYEP